MKSRFTIKLENESGDSAKGEPTNWLTIESESGEGILLLLFGKSSAVITEDEAEEIVQAFASCFQWGTKKG